MRHRLASSLIYLACGVIWAAEPSDARSAALQAACDAGSTFACATLADRFLTGTGVPKDPTIAARLYEKACDGGNAVECLNLAVRYDDGDGVPQDVGKAARLYQKACDGGSATGCFKLGVSYDKGEGVPKNSAKASQLYQQACDGGDADGCFNLAVSHENSEGVPNDQHKATQLYRKACDGGHPDGCLNLGLRFRAGEHVPKDAAKAAHLFQQACIGDNLDACLIIGYIYQTGDGVKKDSWKAARFFERACYRGHLQGCYNSGVVYLQGDSVSQDFIKATQLFRTACNGGHPQGCFNLGLCYANGHGVTKDAVEAAQLYRKACDDNLAAGCFNLGFMYARGEGVIRSGAAAAETYHKAGLLYVAENDKNAALLCVERIQNLTKLHALTVPNAFLADGLLSAIYATTKGSALPGAASTTEAATDRLSSFGTGWVAPKGYVITNHHVVSGATRIRLVLADGKTLNARVAISDAVNDLVLLEPESVAGLPAALPLAVQTPRSGETVFTVGHPYPTLLGSEAKVTDGLISSASGPANDPRLFQVSVPLQPGNSGGPLLNMRGQVVGVVISKLNATEVFNWTNSLPENVGYAIKLAYLTPLLTAQTPTQAGSPTAPPQALADVVARVKPSVVLVIAE